MKLLIIPDIHCRTFWRKTVNNNSDKVDKVIFLGDYLDFYPSEFMDNPESLELEDFYDSTSALIMLEDIFSLKEDNPDKFILLTGNHTDSYIWPTFKTPSRTDRKNWEKYHKFFSQNLDYFNLVWIENDVIISHAGITEDWAYTFLADYMKYDESALEGISFVRETAEVLKNTLLKDFNKYYINAISDISYYRQGESLYGSCEWADIREHLDLSASLINPCPKGEKGIYQIFGHTQLIQPLITDKWACLDCRKGFIFDTLTHECKSCL